MPGGRLMRRLGVALALALVAAAGCDVCGLIQQDVVVPADDPELGSLVDACRNATPITDPACAEAERLMPANDTCACLPLCRRVFEIVNPDPHRPALTKCGLVVDAQNQAHVTIEYRSVCE
jgi:hypothetical protein